MTTPISRSVSTPPLPVLATSLLAVPAGGQTLHAATAGARSATQIGMEPAMGLPTARYRSEATANDAFAVSACKLALARSRDAAVLKVARGAGEEHAAMLRAPVARTPVLAHRLVQLRAARADMFDRLFAETQTAAHRSAWSIHSGFAGDGGKPLLRRAAVSAVRVEERHLHDLPLRSMPY